MVALAARSAQGRVAGLLLGWAPFAGVASGMVVSLPAILVTFLKIGSVLFGSGYVLVALLRSELVDGLGWLTERQLLDAVAVGQATPGPLLATATFIGYVLGGPLGAVVATIGIFLPAFIAAGLSITVLDRLRDSARARVFPDGVNVAAVALIGIVAVQLALGALGDPVWLIIAAGALALLSLGAGAGRLILAGAAVGLIRWVLVPP